MTKAEFLDKLCEGLRFTPDPEEIQKTVDFYSQSIDDRIEDGMSEEAAVAAMGDIETIIAEARASWQQERPGGEAGYAAYSAQTERVCGHVDLHFDPVSVERVDIYDTSGEMSVRPSSDGLIHIEYDATENWRYNVTGLGVLSVRRARNSPDEQLNFEVLGRRFSIPKPNIGGIFENDLRLTLLVPESKPIAVTVNAASGGFSARGVKLDTLSVRLGSGDIEIADTSCAGRLALITASGDVKVRNVSASDFSVNTASGDLGAGCLSCASFTYRSASGDLNMDNAAVTAKLSLYSVSGDLDAELSTVCPLITAETVSGDIGLRLPGDRSMYAVTAKTSSGDIRVPGAPVPAGPNSVRLKTVSGDMYVDFVRWPN